MMKQMVYLVTCAGLHDTVTFQHRCRLPKIKYNEYWWHQMLVTFPDQKNARSSVTKICKNIPINAFWTDSENVPIFKIDSYTFFGQLYTLPKNGYLHVSVNTKVVPFKAGKSSQRMHQHDEHLNNRHSRV